MRLGPHMPLVKVRIVLGQVVMKVAQPISPIHHHAHVNEMCAFQRLEQPTSAGLGSNILDDDLRRADPGSGCHLGLKGSLDTAHVAGKARETRVERNSGRNLLRVGALEALHTTAVKE